MDLKSMLNDSAAQRPPPARIHTSASSVSDRPYDHQTPLEPHPDRPTPHPTSAYPSDGRPGSYFTISPQQNHSASTPGAGVPSAHSAYGQSPGPAAQHYTPRRDSVTPQHVYTPSHGPPPSPVGAPPLTPGTQYHPAHPASYNQSLIPQGASNQRPSTREEYAQTNGRLHQQPSFQMSPPPHAQQTPSTPLGPPPANYHRPSALSQRPPSQGYDHLRRSSIGSIGSNHSRDPSISHIVHHDTSRPGSVQRTHSGEDERLRQERERSDESVSPKTIPRPPPQRTSSTLSHPYEQSPAGSLSSQHASPGAPYMSESHNSAVLQQNAQQQQPVQSLDGRTQPLSRPSPGARPTASITPQSTHSSLPAQPSPPSTKPPSKKRTASVISVAPPTSMPPKKRIKREEIPIWARSARKRRLLLGNEPRRRQPRNQANDTDDFKRDITPVGNPKASRPGPPPPPQDFGLSIMNQKPRNDLIYVICEWVFQTIGRRTPPLGSVFEIEAKLGVIWDIENNDRIRLPVISEAVFDRAGWANLKTKFDTSVMSKHAHQGLNEFLNQVVEHNKIEIDRGVPRDPMDYAHTVEYDEYDELNAQGRKNMQNLAHWANPRHTMKVRRTFRKADQDLRAQIIKTRIADLEVYNPNDLFDYRVSVSLETPWAGDASEFVPPDPKAGVPSDRLKNRLSYKHRDYQIDLTQIDHTQQGRVTSQDHEVEVELMNDSLMPALAEAQATGNADRYERLIGGFIDNIRVLAGHASRAVNQVTQQQQTQHQQHPQGR